MTELNRIREEIDDIDNNIKQLFEKRLACVRKEADYMRCSGTPLAGTERERKIISRLTDGMEDETAEYTKVLYTTIFDISNSSRNRGEYINTELSGKITDALENTGGIFPKSAVVACQGIEGANSQLACERLFSRPDIMYFDSFDAVFTAVDKGLCRYGVLPVENSLHGSVTEVYDLMKRHQFHIARAVKYKINHTLLSKKGVKLSDIKEVFSHEQALFQCSEFLSSLKGVKITACENTAIAARLVSSSDRKDIAAISAKNCADLYNLCVLAENIQNTDNNYTLFICISKPLEIYSGDGKISIMFSVAHKPGALYGVLSKFASLGINISKLESRPIPEKDFEFMFYIDFEANIRAKEIINLICGLKNDLEYFAFLGCYRVL